CINDCAYCINRASNSVKRTAFKPNELSDITISLYKKGYIQGLFLSSGVVRSPEYTMELMLQTVRKLRNEYGFKRYIHLKIMPNSPIELVDEACRLADRVSINIELPTVDSLQLLAPQKTKDSI
ncbi:MAG: biotin synthase, partial [Candidatus Bathyarchaeia archaeon]